MSCGTKHRQAACPKCGSKMKRVGSWWYEIKIALYSHIYSAFQHYFHSSNE
jgi:uncharacterized paraquat-inducible protein A